MQQQLQCKTDKNFTVKKLQGVTFTCTWGVTFIGRVKAIDPFCLPGTLEDNILCFADCSFFCAVLNILRYSAVSNS